MNENQINEYIEELNMFLDELPAQESGLGSAIKIKKYIFVSKWLIAIAESLETIYADELLEDCRAQIEANKDYNNIRHEKLEIYCNFLLSSLSMLASDIKSLYLPKKSKTKR
jgi:hypothetical protein